MDTNKKFGLMVGSAFTAIALYKLIFHHSYFLPFITLGCFLLIAAVIRPTILKLLRIAWELLGEVLGTVNSYIILTIIFFLIVTPISFILKLVKKDTLELKKIRAKESYWQTSVNSGGGSLKQQF